MDVKIYQPAKTAMQSRTPESNYWILEFERENDQYIEPLMYWTGSTNTRSQLKLKFPSKKAAIAYAIYNHLTYVVLQAKKRIIRPQSYQDNFIKKHVIAS